MDILRSTLSLEEIPVLTWNRIFGNFPYSRSSKLRMRQASSHMNVSFHVRSWELNFCGPIFDNSVFFLVPLPLTFWDPVPDTDVPWWTRRTDVARVGWAHIRLTIFWHKACDSKTSSFFSLDLDVIHPNHLYGDETTAMDQLYMCHPDKSSFYIRVYCSFLESRWEGIDRRQTVWFFYSE